MPQYLSQEWHDAAVSLAADYPSRAGASARMAYVVSGAPTGDVKYFQIVDDGRISSQGLGDCPTPDFTVTTTWDDSVKIMTGELDANVAFMQGRMKVAGNMGKLMALLPLTMSDEYRSLQSRLRELTEV